MSIFAVIQKLVRALESLLPSGRYRPELHYMRGPGPKWYARHASVPIHASRR